MKEKQIYWIWLTNLPNITRDKITMLLDYFPDAQAIYEAKPADFAGIYELSQAETRSLMNKDMSQAEKVLSRTEAAGAYILTYDDIHYPDMLRKIPSPPYVLYIKGEMMNWDRILGVAVVGTRHCTDYGREMTSVLCSGLARAGITIISGMARGIDGLAARAALSEGNKTIAVLGSGIDVIYPPEHESLMDAIVHNGAVVTEYPPGSAALPQHFPERNRIISGLARGTLVIEAPMRSGALITANQAMETGKDVFVVPGDVTRTSTMGSNRLINRGGKLVMTAADILEEYVYEMQRLQFVRPTDKKLMQNDQSMPVQGAVRHAAQQKRAVNNIQQISIDDKRFSELKEAEKKIISILIEANSSADEILRLAGVSVSEVNSMLIALEMRGFISKIPGNNYRLNI